MAPTLTIGVTGEVGAGKSTVLEWLVAHGAAGLDADAVVHDLLARDPSLAAAVEARFGSSVATPSGIDRDALAQIVFADQAALSDLERLVHPVVIREARAWLAAQTADVAVVEAAKLVESGFHRELGSLWLVTCSRGVRRSRLVARGWSEADVDRRMAASPPLPPRLALADVVIDNSGSRLATEAQLGAAWRAATVRFGHGDLPQGGPRDAGSPVMTKERSNESDR